MKIRSDADNDSCDVDDVCECKPKPSCSEGFSARPLSSGCFTECEPLPCPAFNVIQCARDGGKVEKVGPCSICTSDICSNFDYKF